MGMKIITGKTLETSVEAADDRAINAAVFGKGEVVFDEGTKFKAELQNNNTIDILDGGASMQGVVFRIPYGEKETLSLDTCSSEYKRIDLICARYSKTENGIEEVKPIVVKGAETKSNPVAPTIEKSNILENGILNYMPLYSIEHNGTNITNIKSVFSTFGNKVLFKGPLQMGEGTVARLSELISAQKTGIVLVWSPYVESVNIQCQFIKKEAISLFPETTHSVFLCNTAFTKVAAKSVYVHDDVILGNPYNTASGTASGITYNNADYTLRYVLGY